MKFNMKKDKLFYFFKENNKRTNLETIRIL